MGSGLTISCDVKEADTDSQSHSEHSSHAQDVHKNVTLNTVIAKDWKPLRCSPKRMDT